MSSDPQQLEENAVRLLKAEIQAIHPSIVSNSSEDLRIHAEVNGSGTGGGEVRFWAGVIRNGKKVNIATGSSRNAHMTPPPSSLLEPLSATLADIPSPEASTPIAVTINVCTSKILTKADITINVDSIN
ncbi:hypothetical protein L5515_007384 [Caenorhabditis briggsae]|uniref:Uncharacterized protein n=1 Tax=Caenorhabditis briggsae TaxID=6238 RepID=A0AAE9JKT6_CAEBR|nr:hypothetical protein L5515_007384 [Caenorhabditis briggsae]